MATSEYYKNQLLKLKSDNVKYVKLTGFNGNETNFMNVNLESVDEIINYLKEEKKRLVKIQKQQIKDFYKNIEEKNI